MRRILQSSLQQGNGLFGRQLKRLSEQKYRVGLLLGNVHFFPIGYNWFDIFLITGLLAGLARDFRGFLDGGGVGLFALTGGRLLGLLDFEKAELEGALIGFVFLWFF